MKFSLGLKVWIFSIILVSNVVGQILPTEGQSQKGSCSQGQCIATKKTGGNLWLQGRVINSKILHTIDGNEEQKEREEEATYDQQEEALASTAPKKTLSLGDGSSIEEIEMEKYDELGKVSFEDIEALVSTAPKDVEFGGSSIEEIEMEKDDELGKVSVEDIENEQSTAVLPASQDKIETEKNEDVLWGASTEQGTAVLLASQEAIMDATENKSKAAGGKPPICDKAVLDGAKSHMAKECQQLSAGEMAKGDEELCGCLLQVHPSFSAKLHCLAHAKAGKTIFDAYNECCRGCLSTPASEEPPAESKTEGKVSLGVAATNSAEMGGHEVEFKSETNSSGNLVSKPYGKEAVYGYGGCSNWHHIYDWHNLCNHCSLQQCVDACKRHHDCSYFGYSGHFRNRCFRMTNRCHIESSSYWQIMYKMVTVTGGWVPTETISRSSKYVIERGWKTRVTTSTARATEKSISAGFTVVGSMGSGSITGTRSKSVSHMTATDIQRHTLTKESHHFSNADGAYLWTWVWTVYPGKEPANQIMTKAPVQSDVRPNCLPGYGADRRLSVCREGGWIGTPKKTKNTRITIGSSRKNKKCVPGRSVCCDNDAGNRGKRVNWDFKNAGDTFRFTYTETEVCAHRTDYRHGWGMNLQIMCKKKECSGPGKTRISIGSSRKNKKCVPGRNVRCDNDAGNRGKRVNWDFKNAGDTFRFTYTETEVCAHRTDYRHGWGMNLQIMCHKRR